MQVVNYLFCRRRPDTCPAKDGCLKVAAAGAGLAVGTAAIYHATKNVKSYIRQETAQHCANQALSMLNEFQRQLQLFNASCTADMPGSHMSSCNMSVLPKLVNASCPDIPVVINYLPTTFVVATLATFGFFMGRSLLTSLDQRNEENESSYFLIHEGSIWNCSTEESTTLSETYQRPDGMVNKTNLLRPPYHRHKQSEETSCSETPEEYSWNMFKDDEPLGSDSETFQCSHGNAEL